MNTNVQTPKFFAGSENCPTIDELKEQFSCDAETAAELLDLAETGFHYGQKGYWPDGEFASDADWANGTGEAIQKLEMRLEVDDNSVFQVFQDAHAAGLEWFETHSN